MIRFYHIEKCSFCDDVVAKLEELVVAYEVFPNSGGEGFRLTEGRRVYRSKSEIRDFLLGLESELITGREMQSDSCVIGQEGEWL